MSLHLHHGRDQSYREPRRAQAAATKLRTETLLSRDEIKPAWLEEAPKRLLGTVRPEVLEMVASTSQVAALGRPGRVGVLVFGSPNRPGGGWLNGAKAQEEDVSLASTWASQAALSSGFYDATTGLGGWGPDSALIARGLWLTDEAGDRLRPARPVVFGGVAAPNAANPAVAKLPTDQRIDALAKRLAAVLSGFHTEGVDSIVLGAIGCGVFRWAGVDSAYALALALAHRRTQGHDSAPVVLAMPDPILAEEFRQALGRGARSAIPRR